MLQLPHRPSRSPKTFNTLLTFGQSNAVGTNSNGTVDTSAAFDSDIRFGGLAGTWPSNPFHSYPADGRPDLGAFDGGFGTTIRFSDTLNFGAERGFCRTLAAAGVGNQLAFKVAVNGQGLDPNWDPDIAGLKLYLLAKTEWLQLRDNIETARDKVDVGAVLWVQFDSDSRDEARANNYKANLTKMVNAMRVDFGLTAATPFILIRAPQWAVGSVEARPYAHIVRAAQEEYAAENANAFLINTDDLAHTGDFTHFTSAAKEQIGIRAAGILGYEL